MAYTAKQDGFHQTRTRKKTIAKESLRDHGWFANKNKGKSHCVSSDVSLREIGADIRGILGYIASLSAILLLYLFSKLMLYILVQEI